jgi:hypothetical protein
VPRVVLVINDEQAHDGGNATWTLRLCKGIVRPVRILTGP